MTQKIIYTKTDEAPALATYSFLPIIEAFGAQANVEFELKDISLAARVLSQFNDILTSEQQTEDALSLMGDIATMPEGNMIKLPNISASVPQLKACISELQAQGFAIPNYPENPSNDQEKDFQSRYAKVLGSAVNPVLREGNSDRRVAAPVKEYAKSNPHRMGAWSADSQTYVAHMQEGDFYGSEKSYISPSAQKVSIELNGKTLKEVSLLENEVIDAARMDIKQLKDMVAGTIEDTKEKGILLSAHLKATMMKVSDPYMFGQILSQFLNNTFTKYADTFKENGIDPKFGLGDVLTKVAKLENGKEILESIESEFNTGPQVAMVDSDKGITNFHVPSDVIIDASMPAMIKTSGKMWDKNGNTQDTAAIIPDRSYAGVYQATIDFCKEHGAFDPSTMGSVSNVGLMAKKAEEYGSHDKTFIIEEEGSVTVKAEDGSTIFEYQVNAGDIWRMCQTKDIAIKDWVKLGVNRAKATGVPAVFWLDQNRAHDANLITKVNEYLKELDTDGLEIKIMAPFEATKYTCQRVKEGKDTISVTGNVLRDYLTDLFPILELGTSAKMLSIVPLLAGGGLYETGAGGSAPKHVQQLEQENHLRWDSLGEFLALQVSIEDFATKTNNKKALQLAKSLDTANSLYLKNDKSPSRKVGEIDNRGTHYYLAMYWAQSLAEQNDDADLAQTFTKVYQQLKESEETITSQLNSVQGSAVDLGGYFNPNFEKVSAVMRPSEKFNSIISTLL